MSLNRSTKRKISTKRNSIRNIICIETDHKKTDKERRLEYDMEAIMTKTLSFVNPNVGNAGVYYSYIDNKFKSISDEEHYLNIFSLDEGLLRKHEILESAQEEYHETKKKYEQLMKERGKDIQETEKDSKLSMRNKLNYAERSSETKAKKIISREIETKKLDRIDQKGVFHQWDLFDSYMANYIKKKAEDKRIDDIKQKGYSEERKKVHQYGEVINRPSLLKALKLLERQIMQIINKDHYHAYRDWNGKEDETNSALMIFHLLPFPKKGRIKNKAVTALCWSTKFEDLFAAGYGNYDFPSAKSDKRENEEGMDNSAETGTICVFSVKNNFAPEIKYKTESGILCLDFHPKEYSFLVAGMYDGSVAVYDISKKSKDPFLTCDIRNQKHMDPVWQIKWYTFDNLPGQYVFFTISSDGTIKKWSFYKSKLQFETEDIIVLKYSDALQEESRPHMIGESEENKEAMEIMNQTIVDKDNDKKDDALLFGNAGGMCFDFNPHKGFENYFVVGTEEGRICLCSINHREHSILNYEGHSMGVYAVAWNPFHPKIFASCSADWTVKIWHYKVFSPLMVYDMESPICDVAWSPWCSTIFASVNVNSQIKFYDLNRARKTPLEPRRFMDYPINHIAFNKSEFVFITGNNNGKVNLFKMAEPLRVTVDPKELEEKEQKKKESEKNAKSGPTTKIVVPQNLQDNMVKVRIAGIQKKQIKVMDKDTEKNRINTTFLDLLDIKDQ